MGWLVRVVRRGASFEAASSCRETYEEGSLALVRGMRLCKEGKSIRKSADSMYPVSFGSGGTTVAAPFTIRMCTHE